MTEVLEKQQERGTELGRISHWIGGQSVAGDVGRAASLDHPARGVQTKVGFASVEEIDRAVQTAKTLVGLAPGLAVAPAGALLQDQELFHQRREDLAAL